MLNPVNEIFIGLVGPVGVDLQVVELEVSAAFRAFNYEIITIQLSTLLDDFTCFPYLKDQSKDEFSRIKNHMKAGTDLREKTNHGDIMAMLAIGKIREVREKNVHKGKYTLERKVFLLKSLKHPDEIQALREVYGQAFITISAYSPREDRVISLASKLACSVSDTDSSKYRNKAEELIHIDESEENKKLGQDVSGAFPLADLFVDVSNRERLKSEIERFLDSLFNNPYITPTKDELLMYLAYGVALRSVDLSRQVGAIIASAEGEVITTGCNDVPKFGGGLYWAGDTNDNRDFRLGFDSSAQYKKDMVAEILKQLRAGGLIKEEFEDEAALLEKCLDSKNKFSLNNTQVMDVIEYGRAVHAEMAALSEAAKRGVSVNNCTLYCTTFPCHLCAKHIVASGIARVVYVQPYPKSQVKALYKDSIEIDPSTTVENRVEFVSFKGIAPTRFRELFEQTGKRKDSSSGMNVEWDRKAAIPKFLVWENSYLELEEKIFGEKLSDIIDKCGLETYNNVSVSQGGNNEQH